MENQHRIYLIECVPTGKQYVGSASFIVQRISRHKRDLRAGIHSNPHLQAAWSKHGESEFRFTQLECVLSQEWLIEAEQRWIDELKPAFNVHRMAASPLGKKASDETRRRMSEARKKYCASHDMSCSEAHRRNISLAQTGKARVFTEKHKRALSISSTGRVLSDDTRKKIGDANRGQTRVFSFAHKAAIKSAWDARKQIAA